MHSAADYAWLTPVLPLVGALITGMGLISFNRTINRLRKPVALFLITCVGAAAVLSYAILASQLAGPRRSSTCLCGPVPAASACRWDTWWIRWVP